MWCLVKMNNAGLDDYDWEEEYEWVLPMTMTLNEALYIWYGYDA